MNIETLNKHNIKHGKRTGRSSFVYLPLPDGLNES